MFQGLLEHSTANPSSDSFILILNPQYMYIHLPCMKESSMPVLDCLCASFRRAARALTQHYDDAMRSLGLTPTQFTILQALSRTGPVPQGRLGEILAMDSTTLTRTLDIITRHGWIEKLHGDDRRQRQLRLTQSGHAQLNRVLPVWQKVQARLRRQLGDEPWISLLALTNKVTSVVTK
jgi:DNA-binding MarR family transcriptional regulator